MKFTIEIQIVMGSTFGLNLFIIESLFNCCIFFYLLSIQLENDEVNLNQLETKDKGKNSDHLI